MNPARLRWIAVSLGMSAFWIAFFHRVAPGTLAGELQSAFAVSGAGRVIAVRGERIYRHAVYARDALP